MARALLTPLKVRAFTGPSLSADWPCVEVKLALRGAAPDAAGLARLSAAAQRAVPGMPALPGAEADRSSIAALADLIARIAVGLQSEAAPFLPRWSISATHTELSVRVGYGEPESAVAAMRTAVRWINASFAPEDPAAAQEALIALQRTLAPSRPGLEERRILQVLHERAIPWRRLANALRIGWGASQRWYKSIMTDRTPSFSVSWATHKPTGAALMASAGIPVPAHRIAADAELAVRIADHIGYPVVLKPAQSDRGVGVRLGLESADQVRQVFAEVHQHGPVVVQRQYPGADHRLLVVGGRLVAAALRTPARVTGDGRQPVHALIAEVNRDPRRGVNHSTILERITIDEEVQRELRSQNLTLDAVPAAGREVRLRRTANLSTGGTSEDVTARVHPDNRALAERAARVVGLDIAGIDFLCPDISRSHLEIGGIVCEINPNPGLRPHLAAPGSPDVIGAIVDLVCPKGDARIPAALVTGTVGKTTTCRMVASILRAAGHTVGLTTTDGVQIDDIRVRQGDEAGPRGANAVLADPAVTAAVLETARGGIIRYGIGPDRYRVGAVLNVGTDHLGLDGIETIDDLARVKSRVLAGATGVWVLNADDPRCLAMAQDAAGQEVVLVGRDAQAPAIAQHLAAGGRAVVLTGEDGAARIVGVRGRDLLVTVAVDDIPATYGGAAVFNVDNARYATAIALAMDASPDAIVAGLTRFTADGRWSSARANLHRTGDITWLLDFAHNTESFDAIGRFAMRLTPTERRILVIDVPGDRTDAALREIAEVTAERFDQFICTTSVPRGRAAGEVSRMLGQSLRERGVASDRIVMIEPFEDALALALRSASAGDLVVIPVDHPRQVLEHPLYPRMTPPPAPPS